MHSSCKTDKREKYEDDIGNAYFLCRCDTGSPKKHEYDLGTLNRHFRKNKRSFKGSAGEYQQGV